MGRETTVATFQGGRPVTPEQLAEVLGEPPVPEGTWEREAVYVSAAALRRGVPPASLAARVSGEVLDNGFLRIVVDVPGVLVDSVEPLDVPEDLWPDFPRTWANPGFVVRYGHARAAAVQRWARDLDVPAGPFHPELLADPRDRAVLRVLAELPGRRLSRSPGWEPYLVRLATAYHDAYELAPPVPVGDDPPAPVHTARVRLAAAVLKVLPGPERL